MHETMLLTPLCSIQTSAWLSLFLLPGSFTAKPCGFSLPLTDLPPGTLKVNTNLLATTQVSIFFIRRMMRGAHSTVQINTLLTS